MIGSNSLYSSNFGPAAVGGTVGGCILFIIGVLIAVFVLRYGHVWLHILQSKYYKNSISVSIPVIINRTTYSLQVLKGFY